MKCTTGVIVILLFGSPTCLAAQGLPAPREFRVTSVDLNCIAEWSVDPKVTHNVTYRLQYKSYWIENNNQWRNISCPDAGLGKCDFTASCAPQSNHTLRVRAEATGATSEWTYACCFEPMISTRLTAPVVSIKVNGLKFSVKVQNLKVRNGAEFLHDVFNNWQWLLNYTEEANEPARERMVLTQNHHVFTVPHAGNYCARAQFHVADFQLYGDQSAVACHIARDAPDPLNLSVIITIALLSTLIVAALAAMGWFYRQKLKALVSPTDPPPPAVLQRLEEESNIHRALVETGLTKSPPWEDSNSNLYCIVEEFATDENSIQLRPFGHSRLQTGSRFHQSARPAVDGLNSGLHSSYHLQVDPKLQSATFAPVHRSMSDPSDCNPAVRLMADFWPHNGQSTGGLSYLPQRTPSLPCTEDCESSANTASRGFDVPYSCIDLNTVTGDSRENSKSDNVLSAGLESKFGVSSPLLSSDQDCPMCSSEIVILVEPASQNGTRYRKTWIVPSIPTNDVNLT